MSSLKFFTEDRKLSIFFIISDGKELSLSTGEHCFTMRDTDEIHEIFLLFKNLFSTGQHVSGLEFCFTNFVDIFPQKVFFDSSIDFTRIHTSSLINIENTLNKPITKFCKGDDVNVIAAELPLTKTRLTSFNKKHNLLEETLPADVNKVLKTKF